MVDTVAGEEGRAHIDHLSRKYHGRKYDAGAISTERVILKVLPEREFVRGY